MAPTKHSVLLTLLAPFFGLPALAYPQTSGLSISLVPVSTISSMSYVPVVTSIATSAITVTQPVPIETVLPSLPTFLTIETVLHTTSTFPIDSDWTPIMASSTPAMTMSPIASTSFLTKTYTDLTHSPPVVVSTIGTTVHSAAAPIGTVAPFVDVNVGNQQVVIGSTCQKKHNGRDREIEKCVERHQPRNICTARDYACQCYEYMQAVKCYKNPWHHCKKDGYHDPLVRAQEDACALKTRFGQAYVERSTSVKVFTRTHKAQYTHKAQ